MTTSAKRLLQQVAQLHAEPVEDVCLLATDSPYEVNALVFGPSGTPFAEGAFRVRLSYDATTYPAAPPTGHFLTKIHHPNVSARGEICVNTLKRDWTRDVTVSHILTIIKCLLISPGPDSALNEDAGRQLMHSYEEWAKVAKMWTGVHAIKIDRAMLEIEQAGMQRPKLSCQTGGGNAIGHGPAGDGDGTGRNVLGDGDVNQGQQPAVPLSRDGDAMGEGHAAKKVKTNAAAATTAEAKKRAEAKKKKTLKRL